MLHSYIIENQGFAKDKNFQMQLKIMLFISDVQNYVPIKLCKTAGSIQLFKIKGMLKPEDIKLNKNYLFINYKFTQNSCS